MQMDTPSDMPARTRFGKFRGLRSWRTSLWDPKENLPREYARVFAFQNPTRAQRRCVFAVFDQSCPMLSFPSFSFSNSSQTDTFPHAGADKYVNVKHLSGHDLRRAKALADEAGKAGDPHSVPAGTYLKIHVADVSTPAAAAVVQQVSESLQVCVRASCCLHR